MESSRIVKTVLLNIQVALLLLLTFSCGTELEDNFCPGLSSCSAGSNESSSGPCDPCIIFVTNNTTNGNLGGVSGADTFCNSDPNKPNSSNYKALVVSGVSRRACTSADCLTLGTAEHIDWVIKPSVVYQRPDSTTIGTSTTEGVFSFNLTNSIGTAGNIIWTGTDLDWTNGADNCLNWASSNGIDSGLTGLDNVVTLSSINGGGGTCSAIRRLYCVEQ